MGGGSVYERVRRGGYVVVEAGSGDPQVVLVASGSEVEVALEARRLLSDSGVEVRVVSLPSWSLFSEQSAEYRAQVLPPGALLVSVEAASTFGWARWVGSDGIRIGIDHFGASAPAGRLFAEFGLTGEAVAERVETEIAERAAGA